MGIVHHVRGTAQRSRLIWGTNVRAPRISSHPPELKTRRFLHPSTFTIHGNQAKAHGDSSVSLRRLEHLLMHIWRGFFGSSHGWHPAKVSQGYVMRYPQLVDRRSSRKGNLTGNRLHRTTGCGACLSQLLPPSQGLSRLTPHFDVRWQQPYRGVGCYHL